MREALKSARNEKHMTQQQMADLLGIQIRAYKYLESGKTVGTIRTWDFLEDYFSIPQRRLRENVENNPALIDSR